MNNHVAIATEYSGFVFRSRTEAYAFEYFRATYPDATIIYESSVYSDGTYTPDFIIGDHQLHIAIEVKPTPKMEEWNVYDRWMETFSCMDDFIVWNPFHQVSAFDKRHIIIPINERMYKQAWNKVKSVIQPRKLKY